jgi:hypothetical protein
MTSRARQKRHAPLILAAGVTSFRIELTELPELPGY